jgi:hypothetical protein
MPNEMSGAAGKYVRTNMAVPTALIGGTPTWRGSSMAPLSVVPLLPGLCFDARGRGVYPLSHPGRFPRGTRISGRRGTMDLWLTLGAIGTARTVAYLTDVPEGEFQANFLAITLDASNRPGLEFQQVLTPLTAATGTFTATGAIVTTETITIEGKAYQILDTLVDADGNVLKGATPSDTLDNLVAAINLGHGPGTIYAASTTLNPDVSAARGAGLTLVVTAKLPGVGGNVLTTTDLVVNGSWTTGGTLVGGVGTTVTIAAVTPSYPAIAADAVVHVRMTWDSANPVAGPRYASLTINGEPIPVGDWSTDPTAAWLPFQPQYLVVAGDPVAGSEFNGTVTAAQLSEIVTP